jgi:hypothetical protein
VFPNSIDSTLIYETLLIESNENGRWTFLHKSLKISMFQHQSKRQRCRKITNCDPKGSFSVDYLPFFSGWFQNRAKVQLFPRNFLFFNVFLPHKCPVVPILAQETIKMLRQLKTVHLCYEIFSFSAFTYYSTDHSESRKITELYNWVSIVVFLVYMEMQIFGWP